jgi:hypothetical protein
MDEEELESVKEKIGEKCQRVRDKFEFLKDDNGNMRAAVLMDGSPLPFLLVYIMAVAFKTPHKPKGEIMFENFGLTVVVTCPENERVWNVINLLHITDVVTVNMESMKGCFFDSLFEYWTLKEGTEPTCPQYIDCRTNLPMGHISKRTKIERFKFEDVQKARAISGLKRFVLETISEVRGAEPVWFHAIDDKMPNRYAYIPGHMSSIIELTEEEEKQFIEFFGIATEDTFKDWRK